MMKHVKPGALKRDVSADDALASELERSGTPPSSITKHPVGGPPHRPPRRLPAALGQVVLVLQGGGALGAYQVGAYQALHEAGIEPDWVIGTSIGAINASLIAGNAPDDRMPRLREFWSRVQHQPWTEFMRAWPLATNLLTVTQGIPAFFRPNPAAFLGMQVPLGADSAGYYDTSPLARTLSELVDFERINTRETRLTVGAANVRTSEMRYFDSRDMDLDLRHVMASGALPPAFPAVRIDGDLYWDGGILSNTPVEAVFDDNPRQNSVVFAVHIWNPNGPEPETIWQVMNRQKDIQYSSRAASHIARQKQIHRLRHVIAELVRRMPEAERQEPGRSGACRLRLPDPHARRAAAGSAARRRGPYQGHRFQPDRDTHAMGGRLRGYEPGARAGALVRRVRRSRRLHPPRGPSRMVMTAG